MATKPLLLPCIMLLVYFSGSRKTEKQLKLLLIALALGWVGDVLLMFPPGICFQLGLGSFLIGHVVYLRLFNAKFPWQYSGLVAWLLFPLFLGLAGWLYWLMYPLLPLVLKMAVGAYALVISMMAFTASAQWMADGQKGFALVALGGLLFLASDGLIAVDKFLSPLGPWAGFWIMATYIPAQWLITEGILKHIAVRHQ